MDGNPISMSLLQWSWENYAFSKIKSPSNAVEGIMTLNLFIRLNCQQFSVVIDSLTLKRSGTINICNVRLAFTELQRLCFQRLSSSFSVEGVHSFERGFLQLIISSSHNKVILPQNGKTSGTRNVLKRARLLSSLGQWLNDLQFTTKHHNRNRSLGPSYVRVSAGDENIPKFFKIFGNDHRIAAGQKIPVLWNWYILFFPASLSCACRQGKNRLCNCPDAQQAEWTSV